MTPTAAPARPAVPVKIGTIEDTQIGHGCGLVEYSGASWTRCGGCDVATPNSSYYYAYQVGDRFTVRFRGRQLVVFAPDDHGGGVAAVSVDGAPAGQVNYFNPGTLSNGVRWTSAVLGDGEHEVAFTITAGTSSEAHVELFDHADVYA